jgi:hypothetical protein
MNPNLEKRLWKLAEFLLKVLACLLTYWCSLLLAIKSSPQLGRWLIVLAFFPCPIIWMLFNLALSKRHENK